MSAPTALNHDELADVITRCAGSPTDGVALRANPTFADIGVDSLGLLGVVAELERTFGVQFGADAETCASPAELLDIANAQLRSAARS